MATARGAAAAAQSRLLVLDFCGTLSHAVTRFDVAAHLEKHGLTRALDERAYWALVQETWAQLSTSPDGTWASALHAEVAERAGCAAGVEGFLADYWRSHTIDPRWRDVLAAVGTARVEIATSAALGHAKKDPRFWGKVLRGGAEGTATRVVIASDHYIDAEGAMADAMKPIACTRMPTPIAGDSRAYRDVIVVDDFGACEQAGTGYEERRAATERAVRAALPAGSELHIVQVRPGVDAHFQTLRGLLNV